ERLLAGQMNPDYFPVALGDLAAKVQMHEFRGPNFQIGDIAVAATYLNHPGMTLGYKILCGDKAIVYATDNEQYTSTLEHVGQRAEAGRAFGQRLDEAFVSFVSQADLYIGEAQYTDAEYPEKIGWGHSPLSATVEVALKAGAKALALFHHDPMHSDDAVAQMEAEAQRLVASRGGAPRCLAAREGQTPELWRRANEPDFRLPHRRFLSRPATVSPPGDCESLPGRPLCREIHFGRDRCIIYIPTERFPSHRATPSSEPEYDQEY